MKNYRIKGAKVRLNATQADAYFLFLKEGILNFYTLGFYRRCPCRCGPCKNRTTYPRWLDKHVEWDGAPPPGTTNEFQIFNDKLVCCQKLTMWLFNLFFGFLPFLQIFAATCKHVPFVETLYAALATESRYVTCRFVQAASLQPAVRRHPAGVWPWLLLLRYVRQVPLDDVLGLQLLRHLVRPLLTLQG